MQNPTECVLIGNENIRVDLNLIHENSIFNVFFTTMQCVQWLSYLFPPCIIITMVINCHHHPYHHHVIIIMHFSSISAVYHLQITNVCVLNVTAQSHSEHTHHATWQISPHMQTIILQLSVMHASQSSSIWCVHVHQLMHVYHRY